VLGENDIFNFAPNVRLVRLEGNPILAVSDNLVAKLPNLTAFSLDQAIFQQSFSSGLTLQMFCQPGYANDFRRPTYCGMQGFFV
jgi:hypothetical protein